MRKKKSALPYGKLFKTTISLPQVMDRNLDLCCVILKLPKGELFKTAVADFIRKQGLDPEAEPNVSVIEGKVIITQ